MPHDAFTLLCPAATRLLLDSSTYCIPAWPFPNGTSNHQAKPGASTQPHVPGLPMQDLRKPRWGSGWWLAPQTSRVGGRAGFERTLSLVTGSEEASVPILTC